MLYSLDLDRIAASVDHGFDGKHHVGLEDETGSRLPVVIDVRRLVELDARSVPYEMTHHRIAVGLGVLLDGVAYVAQRVARLYLCDPADNTALTVSRRPAS